MNAERDHTGRPDSALPRDPSRPLPHFVIGGAPKCGTTSLIGYLAQHPDVFTTEPKEPHHFASAPLGKRVMQGDYSWEEYLSLFGGCTPDQVCGEGSTHYLHHAEAVAPYLAERAPNVRLVFCLREPVARARSHYLFRYATAGPYTAGGVGSHCSFPEFARDPEVFSMGDYARNLTTYYRYFDPEQVLVLFLDDLRTDSAGTVARICAHIGADPSFEFDLSERENETEYARWPTIMPVVDRVAVAAYARASPGPWRKWVIDQRRLLFSADAPKPSLNPRERAEVAALYEPSIERLQEMTGRDLSSWLR